MGSNIAVYRWVDNFNDGSDSVKRRHSRGQLTEASTKKYVTKVKSFVDDRRWTFEEIANNVVISHGSVYSKQYV